MRGEQHPSQPGSKHSGGALGSPSWREPLSPGCRLRAARRLAWRRPPLALLTPQGAAGPPSGLAGEAQGDRGGAPGTGGGGEEEEEEEKKVEKEAVPPQPPPAAPPRPWAAGLSPAPRRCRPGVRSRAQVLK